MRTTLPVKIFPVDQMVLVLIYFLWPRESSVTAINVNSAATDTYLMEFSHAKVRHQLYISTFGKVYTLFSSKAIES